MIEKFNAGFIPQEGESNDIDRELRETAEQTLFDYDQAMEEYGYIEALDAVFRLIRKANQYIEISAPWELAKDTAQKGRLATVLYQLTEVIRVSTLLLQPFIPGIPEKVWLQLGLEPVNDGIPSWGYNYQGARINRGQPLFPRLDLNEVCNRFFGKD